VRLCGCIAVRTRVPGYKTHASLDAFCEKFSERVGERLTFGFPPPCKA
jgi:hypothetical protein